FNNVLALDADNVVAVAGRSEIYRLTGRYDDALSDADHLIALEPDDVGALINRGQLYQLIGRNDEALADFERAVELDPDNLGVVSLSLTVLLRRGEAGDFDRIVSIYRTLGTHAEQFVEQIRAVNSIYPHDVVEKRIQQWASSIGIEGAEATRWLSLAETDAAA